MIQTDAWLVSAADRRNRRTHAGCVFFVGIAGATLQNSIGWVGYGVVAAALLLWSIVLLKRCPWGSLPFPVGLLPLLLTMVLSVTWSHYRLETIAASLTTMAATAAAVTIAVGLPWNDIAGALATALRWILVGSVGFEIYVAAIVRHPILPVWATPPEGEAVPDMLYWSRDVLFTSGQIQGLPGNSALLAMAALLLLVITAAQARASAIPIGTAIATVVLSGFVLVVCQSATVFVAGAVVLGVSAAARIVARACERGRITAATVGLLVALVASLPLAFVLRTSVLTLLGKSEDLTGRREIWSTVIATIHDSPWLGYGWIGYWAPWVEPLGHLIQRNGLPVLHAHNAWLDIQLQLGVPGLLLLGTLFALAVVRAWNRAVSQRPVGLAALPLLLLSALFVQSLTESRILIEGGWIVFTTLALVLEREQRSGS